MAKKKTMIYLTERQQWQLKLHAQETGDSMAGLIRTAVDEFLSRERPRVDYMAIVGMIEGEPGDDASQCVDEIVGEAIEEDYLRSQGAERTSTEKKQPRPGSRKYSTRNKKSA